VRARLAALKIPLAALDPLARRDFLAALAEAVAVKRERCPQPGHVLGGAMIGAAPWRPAR
jgi:hypothetical protein